LAGLSCESRQNKETIEANILRLVDRKKLGNTVFGLASAAALLTAGSWTTRLLPAEGTQINAWAPMQRQIDCPKAVKPFSFLSSPI
jgi:hypothetical protein